MARLTNKSAKAKLSLTIGLLILSSIAFGQGIKFENDKTWAQIKQMAKDQNKMIFMDCYTTWCGPCKAMSKDVFPKKTVGDFMNNNFISIQVQMDTSKLDNGDVKKWYADAHRIALENKLVAYPSLYFYSSDGNLIQSNVGYCDEKGLIEIAAKAKDPKRWYSTLLGQYRNGDKSINFIQKLVPAALEANDRETAVEVGDIYLASLKNPYTKDHLGIIFQLIGSSKNKAFQFVLKDPRKINKIMGEPRLAEGIIRNVIYEEQIHPVVLKAYLNKENVDWVSLSKKSDMIYPPLTGEIILLEQIDYYQQMKEWDKFGSEFTKYLERYGDKMQPFLLNNYLWTLFVNVMDIDTINKALPFAKKYIVDAENGSSSHSFDTYANLLYKAGKTNEAIYWEEKALEIDPNDPGIVNALNNMRLGQPTWPQSDTK
jgi:thioredoxin-related protein